MMDAGAVVVTNGDRARLNVKWRPEHGGSTLASARWGALPQAGEAFSAGRTRLFRG